MSTRLITLSLAATLFASTFALGGLASSPARAGSRSTQPGDSVRSRFYNFGEQLVNGSTRGPALDLYKGRRAADFGRLLSLKKDLLPRILSSRAEHTFK